MATGDIKYHELGGRTNPVVRRFVTKSGKTAINAGEPVMFPALFGDSSDYNYVIALTDAKPLVNTDYFVGIAATAGSHTSTADGYVDVYIDLPGMIWKAKAKTSTTFDTQGEVDSSLGYLVAFDLTSSSYTVDTTKGSTNGLIVVGGDASTAEVFFMTRNSATWYR